MQMDKKKKILCFAPHPDDETLGCGGTLLRHVAEGDEVHWLIITSISEALGFPSDRVLSRKREIEQVATAYGFKHTHQANFPTTTLDCQPRSELVKACNQVISEWAPDVLYVPYRNDVHSDHAVVFDVAISCSKSFRYPSIKQICAYETLSETEFGLRPDDPGFRPNLFVDIAPWLDRKIEIMKMYAGEMGEFPFPRSETCLRANALLRGSQAGVMAAEAFMILKEIR